MSTTIYVHEFRSRLKSVIIWSVATAAILFFFGSIFPGFAAEAGTVKEVLSKFPPALLDAFGMRGTDLSTMMGFYGFLFVFVQLCLAIQAGNYGFGLVSIEESELTADFLLSKPVSRIQVITSKLLASITSLIITDAVVWVFSFVTIATFNAGRPYNVGTLVLVLASVILFQLFFLAVGLVISLLVKRVRSVTPYSLGLGFGMYVLNAFSGISADVKLEYVTPFKHLDPGYIIKNTELNTPLVLLDVAVTIIAVAVSYWLYVRRDIHAAS